MSVSNDILNLPPLPLEVSEEKIISSKIKRSSKTVITDEVDWKSALVMGLDTRNAEKIKAERQWAALGCTLRDMCPETNWIFINQESKSITTPEETALILSWIEGIVAVPEWPFPDTVIFMAQNKKNKRTWKLAVPKLQKDLLPFSEPPLGLVLIPFRDKFCSGWKISIEEMFETEKAGLV